MSVHEHVQDMNQCHEILDCTILVSRVGRREIPYYTPLTQ